MDSVIERSRCTHSYHNTLCGVGCRCNQTTEVVAHHLLAQKVGTLNQSTPDLDRSNTIAGKPCIILIVAIVAVAVGVVSGGIQAPLVVENMAHDELIVYLCVVVGVVVVEAHHISVNYDFTLGVVATILRHLLCAQTRIGEIDLRHATKREKLYGGACIVVARLQHIR